jgi:hypothetical protein
MYVYSRFCNSNLKHTHIFISTIWMNIIMQCVRCASKCFTTRSMKSNCCELSVIFIHFFYFLLSFFFEYNIRVFTCWVCMKGIERNERWKLKSEIWHNFNFFLFISISFLFSSYMRSLIKKFNRTMWNLIHKLITWEGSNKSPKSFFFSPSL